MDARRNQKRCLQGIIVILFGGNRYCLIRFVLYVGFLLLFANSDFRIQLPYYVPDVPESGFFHQMNGDEEPTTTFLQLMSLINTNNATSMNILPYLLSKRSEHNFQYIDCKSGGVRRMAECKGLQPLIAKGIVTLFPLIQKVKTNNKSKNDKYQLGNVVLHEPHGAILMSRLNPRSHLYKELLKAADEDAYSAADGKRTREMYPTIPSTEHASVLIVPNAIVNTETGFVETTFGKTTYTIRFNGCNGDIPSPVAPFDISTLSKIPSFDAAVYFYDIFARTFYHSSVEQLSRIVAMQDILETAPRMTLLHRRSPLLVTYTRHLLGDEVSRRMQDVSSSPYFYSNNLVVPEPSMCAALQPAEAHRTRTLIHKSLRERSIGENRNRIGTRSTEKHILLLRRRSKRVIDNHDELYTGLVNELPRSAKVVVFDDANLPQPGPEQWKMFQQSKIVVAPHGAGLSGILACDPDTVVVEILGEGPDLNVCYWNMAASLGLEYHPLTMNITNSTLINPKRNTRYYRVDAASVAQTVRDINSRLLRS